jgi:hypothetical protein
MGFECPPRQTTADFLTSLTNPDERIVRAGFENKVPRSPDEFADEWRMSQHRASLLNDIAAFEIQYPLDGKQVEALKGIRRAQKAKFTFVTFNQQNTEILTSFVDLTRALLRSRSQCRSAYVLVEVSRGFSATRPFS